jgi:syndecan 4
VACTACPNGTYSTVGAAACTLCGPGFYSEGGAGACLPCSAGYICNGTGSTTPTRYACPAGTSSAAGASHCAPCPAGTFGATSALTNNSCSGSCPAGYACPSGSTNATAAVCPPGTYAPSRSGVCIPCPAGRYGSQSGANSSACTGPCLVTGSYCPPGSNSTASAVPCPPGTYANASTGLCEACPTSTPYSLAGSTVLANCSTCSSGCSGGYGTLACGDTTWTAWVDGAGVEGGNSCLKVVGTASSWSAAKASCAGLGSGASLISTSQVGAIRRWDSTCFFACSPL